MSDLLDAWHLSDREYKFKLAINPYTETATFHTLQLGMTNAERCGGYAPGILRVAYCDIEYSDVAELILYVAEDAEQLVLGTTGEPIEFCEHPILDAVYCWLEDEYYE